MPKVISYRLTAMATTLMLVSFLVLGTLSMALSAPFHASCKVQWNIGASCSVVTSKIINQIHAWEGPAGCAKGGEKCLYKLVKNEQMEITATHETPKSHYVDDLTFKLTDSSADSCSVAGFSTSETWYAVLDQGTNYCNLHNLITGAELDKSSGFSEKTSNSICTQYSTANCDVY
eukprot:GHVO01059887.1.p1 GENE.GHVO01059887.1~~GHVO01059887.1.p1  ORF type:complete len:175 (+),score=6.15 GHVO01059887.1:80-604(+)